MTRVFLAILLALCGAQYRPFARGVSEARVSSSTSVLVAFAGYNTSLVDAQVWALALASALAQVGTVFAVDGPTDVFYANKTDDTLALARTLRGGAGVVLAAAHSSGSYVAQHWLQQLDDDTLARVHYFSLEGGLGHFSGGSEVALTTAVARGVAQLHAVSACSSAALCSPNIDDMRAMRTLFPWTTLTVLDASRSGCLVTWCLHMVPVNAVPHNPNGTDVSDYTQFTKAHPLQTKQYMYA
jgi:hypothetical protein